MRRLLTALVAFGAAMVTTAGIASAQTSPYTGTGYDVSYPQCLGALAPPGTFSFGIVGVNHGRPFTQNQCLSPEYGAAPQTPAPSFYINAAYSGAYRRNITPYCSQQPQSTAWQIGCSEAYTSFGYAGQPATSAVTMWWLDVETANSWSTADLTLNQAAIQGATDFLVSKGFLVGVYSTTSSWQTITGHCSTPSKCFAPNNSAAEWVAGGSCSTPFNSKPVWLSQSTSGGFDYDTAC